MTSPAVSLWIRESELKRAANLRNYESIVGFANNLDVNGRQMSNYFQVLFPLSEYSIKSYSEKPGEFNNTLEIMKP